MSTFGWILIVLAAFVILGTVAFFIRVSKESGKKHMQGLVDDIAKWAGK